MDKLVGGIYWTPKESYVGIVQTDHSYNWIGMGYKMEGVYTLSEVDTKVAPLEVAEWTS